ncbi:uncharacterized protein TNCV_1287971 [Trichonephila clavipes]|nr:uncharacterized protein TNCV_1287971 [Trichonephila clavipes]
MIQWELGDIAKLVSFLVTKLATVTNLATLGTLLETWRSRWRVRDSLDFLVEISKEIYLISRPMTLAGLSRIIHEGYKIERCSPKVSESGFDQLSVSIALSVEAIRGITSVVE